ncbi:probable ADP-ribosylation factor GTPase-activating protein AGD9 isoform X2 [Benincasa hispida]|uniref:probable ADP-ribosylation factor GTPase-activating protein AGD9 isoform X2 n=1 Tax=Benincasa hispida TaxID=102211 RepID=UPI0018FF7199|nr:probable ADP-ribosylation factor GTPase-activating protein AGD9 isoform X2 [Benincasa hispida]XP_038886901.1 probable ADP-ribosylation factor GTPase-activating protein AGD9 isoform X2 [Benincasa hispida]
MLQNRISESGEQENECERVSSSARREEGERSGVPSTNLDSWSTEQLKMMSYGGNNRAQVFFKQHGWNDGGKIEAKYTSRAADLYKQTLSKEVAKTMAEDPPRPSSPVSSHSNGNAIPLMKTTKQEAPEVSSPKASHSVVVKKPIGAKRTGKIGGLGARKLTTKTTENLYDQKPEDPPTPVSSSITTNGAMASSLASRFEYVENAQSSDVSSNGSPVIGHIAPPKSSSFFAEFGMDNNHNGGVYSKKSSSNSTKIQVEETEEARKKFSNAKSISSAQFFGDQNKSAESEAKASLQKFTSSSAISSADLFGQGMDDSTLDLAAHEFISRISLQASQDISSLKNIAGETGRKLSSLASTLITDIQDRIL